MFEDLSPASLLSGSKPHHGGSLLRCFLFSWVTTSTVDGVWSHSVRRLKRSGILIDRARGPDSKVSTGRSVYISQPLSEGFPSNIPFAWYPLDPRRFLYLLTAGLPTTTLVFTRTRSPRTPDRNSTLSAQDRIPFGICLGSLQTPHCANSIGHWRDPDWTLFTTDSLVLDLNLPEQTRPWG